MTVRKATARGVATRGRIVDAAAVLFHERGVDATGLGEVLAASGTGKSQLYHHFAGKAGLIDEVVDTQAGRILTWHGDLLAEVGDVTGLRAWADAVVAAAAERRGAHGCPLGSLAAELADRSEQHREHVARGFARWEDLLAAAVERAGVDPEGARTAAAALLAALQGGLLLAEVTREVGHLRIGLDTVLDGVAREAERHSRASADDPRPVPRRR